MGANFEFVPLRQDRVPTVRRTQPGLSYFVRKGQTSG